MANYCLYIYVQVHCFFLVHYSGNRISYGRAAGISVLDEGKADIIGEFPRESSVIESMT